MEHTISHSDNLLTKKIKICTYSDIEDSVLQWVINIRNQNLPVSGPLIQEKALEFAQALGHTDFKASVGWLDKFKKRHKIIAKVICGESADVNTEASDDWMKIILPNIIKDYKPENIFNADETALFYKCLPSKTLTFKNDKCAGGKRSKERITLMVGSNMSGTEKLKLLVIGKYKNPRCFKGLQSLPIDYESNKKSWMTSEIFEKWLLKLDTIFAKQKRNVLFFVDNCPAHPKSVQTKLAFIKLVYFPPNMTSIIQPMDQGIIQNLKHHYRKYILKTILDTTPGEENVFVSLLDAIRNLNKAWNNDVTQVTIANCFRKAGFQEIDNEASELSESVVDESESIVNELWNEYEPTDLNISLEEYINVDRDCVTMSFPIDEEILQSVLRKHYSLEGKTPANINCKKFEKLPKSKFLDSESSGSEVEIEHIKIPTLEEAASALTCVQNFIQSRDEVPEKIFQSLNEIEKYIDNQTKWNKNKQTKITNYFT